MLFLWIITDVRPNILPHPHSPRSHHGSHNKNRPDEHRILRRRDRRISLRMKMIYICLKIKIWRCCLRRAYCLMKRLNRIWMTSCRMTCYGLSRRCRSCDMSSNSGTDCSLSKNRKRQVKISQCRSAPPMFRSHSLYSFSEAYRRPILSYCPQRFCTRYNRLILNSN